MSELDPSTQLGARTLDQLASDPVGWLTTINPDGQPQASPVWFLWRDGEIVIYSHKRAPRNANIEDRPLVAFNLNTDPTGEEVASMEGLARIDLGVGPAVANPDYQVKYGERIAGHGWSPEWHAGEYPIPIVVRPTRWRLA